MKICCTLGRFASAISLLCLVTLAQGADIYKWKDSDGQIRYTDLPPPGKVPYQVLTSKKPGADKAGGAATDGSGAEAAQSPADRELDARRKQASADEQRKKDLQKMDDKKIREQNCATARNNMINYKIGGRMYKIDDKGERAYLSDAEIASGLENAKRDVQHWCDE